MGNLGDITCRALEVLRSVEAIACEDTRHARPLLDHYGIQASTFPLHEHNERAAAEKLIERLRAGQRVALISDAGTPAVSDPGARAVVAVRAAGFPVIPLPGPNAAVTALSASGLAEGPFVFVGFLPPKTVARRKVIAQWRSVPAALVFYEAPHRIEETVADLVAELPADRELVIARELTKLFEQIVRLPLHEAPAWLAGDANHRRGEFVLAVSAPAEATALDGETDRILSLLLAELPTKTAARIAAELTGLPRNDLYQRILTLKDDRASGDQGTAP